MSKANKARAGAARNPAIDKGIYLGAPDGIEGARLRYKEDKHVLAFGPTGSGKSTALAVPNLATLRRSMLVMDPKCQLTSITGRLRETMGPVIPVDPYDLLEEKAPHLGLKSAGWNPLMQLDRKSPNFASQARAIAQAVTDRGEGGGNHDFFDASAENIFTGFCMRERVKHGDKASLRNVREDLAEGALENGVKEMAQSNNYAMRIIGKRLQNRLTNKNAQSTSVEDVIDTILKNTSFLDDDRIGADMRRGGAIDFAALHREITTIYVILPVGQLEKQAKWLRLFVNLALEALFEEAPPVALLPRVLFLLDEFGNLGRLPKILNALQIARDYRVQLFCLLQNLQQLKTHYPNEWSYFFSAAGAKTSFAAGDMETAEYFSKMFGKQQVEMWSQNDGQSHGQNQPIGFEGGNPNAPHPPLQTISGSNGRSSGRSVSTQIFDLMPPEDMLRLGRGGTVNIIEPCKMPVRGFAPHYRHFDMAKDLDPNPYYLG